ncbi:MAG: Allantoate amidohydrolase [uncultured Thermomicrobiales bacterium]|uniref:Allantoate amidohydrolase n=1 Tax=uncultured Thermomicrobiales bacterium TaxID=1645740 RepID=A0A6J4TYG0_9BACT|nr:MAG: Allantoate amidohydrolase [uncultured Thermomicrobiales bacterium]
MRRGCGVEDGEHGAIRIAPDEVAGPIAELARFGAHGETGVWRTVYSPEWVAAADWYAAQAEAAGLAVRRDAVGNVWARLDGTEDGKSIATGSHLDSQRPGGQYDGALGAIGGLVALRKLRERFGQPRRTLEAVALCEEEASRFPTANFWGSRAIIGQIAPGDPEATIGYDGETIAAAMRAIGLDPDRCGEARRDDLDTFVELHIEQGPLLEQQGLPVGVVSAITGLRHYAVTLHGTANHAGAFPMDLRRDPMAGAAEIISGVVNTAHRMGRPAVTTVGRLAVEPNGAAIVPERVTFTVDARHPDPAARARLYAKHEALIAEVAARRDLDVSWEITHEQDPCVCDAATVATLEAAARALGVPFTTMTSGAVHDTQQMAAVAKVAMVFIQSRDGRSHTPEEYSSPEHLAAGVEVLTEALRRLAY